MSGTIQHLVRKAVIDGLAALPALADVRCAYAYEFGEEAQVRERIFTDRARAQTPPAAIRSGRNHRDETTDFDLVLLVEGVGMSAYETDERTAVLQTAVEEWLADRKSNELGMTGLNWIRAERWESTNLGNDRGSLTEWRLTIRYNARLT